METSLTPCVGARYNMDGRIYEIISVTDELVSLRDVEGKRAQYFSPADFSLLLFNKDITQFQAAPLQESNATYFLHADDPRVAKARRKYFYVKGLYTAFRGQLPRAACIAEIQQLAKQSQDLHPPSYSAVWAWTRQCKKHNYSPFALLKMKSRRPRGKISSADTMAIIDRYITESYLSAEKNNVAYVYKLICGQIIHDNFLRRENNAKCIPTPSLSTLHRRIGRQCGFRHDSIRLGERMAQKNNKFGIHWANPARLLEQVELDATPLDLQVVDAKGELLGRVASLQAAIDVKSNKVIGYDLSLTPPCAEKTLRVFRMILTAVEGEELQRGKMQELVIDNGTEVANDTVKVAAEVLGIQLRFVPPNTPDAKPHIERFFKTMNDSFVHTLPGTTFSNPEYRGDYDSAGKACFTIEQIQGYFKTWLEDYYHNLSSHTDHLSPNQRWDRAMATQLPPLKYSEQDLRHLLRSVERRSINGGRVTFSHLSWTGPGLAEMERRLRPGQKAIIYYDASNLAEVFVALDGRPDELFRAAATRPNYQKDLTLYEHKLVRHNLQNRFHDASDAEALSALWKLRQKISDDASQFRATRRKRPKSSGQTKTREQSPSMPEQLDRHLEAWLLEQSSTTEDFETYYLSDIDR